MWRRGLPGLLFAVFATFAVTTLCSAQTASKVDTSAPDALIRSLSQDILDTARNDPAVKAGDINRINQLVNEKLLPYADFEHTTRLAMGRYWRQATDTQKQQLIEQFKLLLVHTYAGATSKIGDQSVTVKPLHVAPGDTDVVVHSEIDSQGKAYPVDYRMQQTPTGWKIYDVNVLNVWLVATYRSQFSSVIQQQGIDGLIASLTQRNADLAARGNLAASANK
ncbi:MAG: MlaC/ttg2D family ABC transporter substrate-binding protein [Janthinobacterium lividum]